MPTQPADIVATRRQLHAIAESFIAGPQYRAHQTIRLAARPDGVAGTALQLSIVGTRLVWPDGSAELDGPVADLAAASGISPGPPPETLYESVEPLSADAELRIDPAAAELLYRALFAGYRAVKTVVAESDPVLWPEHFDVGAVDAEVNYGVSAGDGHDPLPYAYVGPWRQRAGDFWNAPFGASYGLDTTLDPDTLTESIVDFFRRAQAQL